SHSASQLVPPTTYISPPFFSIIRRLPRPPLFPYTTLFRSPTTTTSRTRSAATGASLPPCRRKRRPSRRRRRASSPCRNGRGRIRERKSTRLNSSHLGSSYAVFCSKKKPLLHLRESVGAGRG